jgi:hypothetical protein
VIDLTPHYHDWQCYANKLDIKILTIKKKYSHIPLMYQKIMHIKDNFNFFDGMVCGIDADVILKNNYNFFLDEFFHVYFNNNMANCGLYYFKEKNVCELWCEYINSCFSKKINLNFYLKNKNLYSISDEAILSYLIETLPFYFSKLNQVALVGKNYQFCEKDWYHFLSIGTNKKNDTIIKFQDFHEIFKTIIKNYNLPINLENPTTTLKKYYNRISFL